jgi:hypothetical protein
MELPKPPAPEIPHPPPPPPPPVTTPTPKPVSVAASATPPASAIAVATTDTTRTAPPASASKAAVDRAECLRRLAAQTAFLEAYLKKAAVIRDNTRAEANSGNDSEAFNQYVLRYYADDLDAGRMLAPNAIRYAKTMMLPATTYRYAYALAETGAAQAKKIIAAPDASPEEKTAAEALAKRLHLVRKDSLLGAAEVFCLIRRLGVAGHIYDLLLKDYPSDSEIQDSDEHFLKIRNKPRPVRMPHGPGE